MQLNNQDLLQTTAFINGKWTGTGNTFNVSNPANGQVIATVADTAITGIEKAITAAHRAYKSWSRQTAKHRAALLRKWYELIVENAEDLAMLMTAEQGKPLAEAKGEVTYGASFVEWFAEEARRAYGDVIPAPLADRRILAIKQPIGVVAAITPWNFPIAMITRKVAPALAAGCTVVAKPASSTPLCALALAWLAQKAGFPPGVFNVVTPRSSAEAGKLLATHPLVSKLSFTGSTAVGKQLMEYCASTVKKVSLELGGNAPLIVFDDARIDIAVKGAIASKYRNAGQTCVCANRIYVQKGIEKKFLNEYLKAIRKLKTGNGMQQGTDIGPLINDDAVKKIDTLLKDATKKGGKIITGGKRLKTGELYYPPTLITNCNHKMKLSSEEIFGPVSAIYTFSTEAEAIQMANDTEYGLAAYFFTTDLARSWRVAEALDFGIIGINEGLVSHAEAPFGGVKQSGIGREGSKYGMEEYLETKYLCIGGL